MKKVRVYNFESREMWIADGYDELSELFMALSTDDSIFSEPMQSTGLLDKKGNDVFEGDVVIAWSQGVKGTFEIKRRIDGLWLLCPAWKDGEFWYLSPTEDGCETIEIIGNVYQNSELLESVE
jgi:uncharacterized phage protein (TIGR01671 family)